MIKTLVVSITIDASFPKIMSWVGSKRGKIVWKLWTSSLSFKVDINLKPIGKYFFVEQIPSFQVEKFEMDLMRDIKEIVTWLILPVAYACLKD